MSDIETDPDRQQHVTVAAHMLAMRSFQLRHPNAPRGAAWEYASQNWQEFLVRAVIFVVARGFREERRKLENEGEK